MDGPRRYLQFPLGKRVLAEGDFEIVGTDQAGATATLTGNVQCRRPSFGPQADDAAKFSIDLPLVGMPALVIRRPGAPPPARPRWPELLTSRSTGGPSSTRP